MGLLRELFGPSKHEIWSQLSQEIGADYAEDGFFKKGKVVLTHRQWEITLDTYVVRTGRSSKRYTRMRAPYVNPDGFRFNIYRKGLFSDLGKLFGMQDIEVGDPFFDEEFIIQSDSEVMIKGLLANPEIRRLLQAQPDVNFQVKDDEGWFGKSFPEGVDELHFLIWGLVANKQRLKELFDLFTAVLDELCRMGSAYGQGPGVKLD